jgi:Putative zinc-finger
MNHDEVIRLMGAEQYLLNELSPELREQFEEHFFECIECANDVRAGALFLEHSKAIFAAEAAAPQRAIAPSRPEKNSWWAWLRPTVAVPVFSLLLAVIAYQNWPSPRSPQILQAAYVNIGSRGGNVPSISTRQDEGFLLRVSMPPAGSYSSYSADIYAPDGKLQWSLKLPYTAEGDSYFVQIPRGHHQEGVYAVAIRGTGADGRSTEIGRSSFELHILNKS